MYIFTNEATKLSFEASFIPRPPPASFPWSPASFPGYPSLIPRVPQPHSQLSPASFPALPSLIPMVPSLIPSSPQPHSQLSPASFPGLPSLCFVLQFVFSQMERRLKGLETQTISGGSTRGEHREKGLHTRLHWRMGSL